MEPVYCPNGHPNRPGARLCAVCRALISPPETAATAKEKTAAPKPPTRPPAAPPVSAPPPRPAPEPVAEPIAEWPVAASEPETPAAPPRKRRPWLWLLALLLLGFICVAAVWTLLFPVTRLTGEPSTMIFPTVATVAVVTVEPVETESAGDQMPTSISAATDAPSPTADVEEEPTATSTVIPTITPLSTIVGVVITPTFAFGSEANFIQNGDFAADWHNGWTSEQADRVGRVFVRPATEDPDIQALRMEIDEPGVLQLAQRVVLAFPVEGLVFRGQLSLSGTAGRSSESRAALVLRYEDANGDTLGATVWLDGAAESTDMWDSGPLPELDDNVSVRYLSADWQPLELWLGEELATALPDIDPVAVRQITVLLALLGGDDCAPAGCAAALEAAGLSLTAETPD